MKVELHPDVLKQLQRLPKDAFETSLQKIIELASERGYTERRSSRAATTTGASGSASTASCTKSTKPTRR